VKVRVPVFVCGWDECWGYFECLAQGYDPDTECVLVDWVEVDRL